MLLDQGPEGVAGQQRHVAVGHEDGALEVGRQRVEGAFGRPPGALDLVLVGDHGLGVDLGDVRSHEVTLVADDHGEVLGVDRTGRSDGVPDQGPTPDPVQDLGGRGLHPGAFTGGEDDDGG